MKTRFLVISLFLGLLFSVYGQQHFPHRNHPQKNDRSIQKNREVKLDSMRRVFLKRRAFEDSIRKVIEKEREDRLRMDSIRQVILKKEGERRAEQERRMHEIKSNFEKMHSIGIEENKINQESFGHKRADINHSADFLKERPFSEQDLIRDMHTKEGMKRYKEFLRKKGRAQANFPVMAVPQDSNEPNDFFKDATSVSIGDSTTDLSIDPAGDIDIYKFTGNADQWVEIKIWANSIGSELDSYIYLYGADTTNFLIENDDFEIQDSRIVRKLNHTGDFYIKVREFNHPNKGGSNYYYNITLKPSSPMGAISGTVYKSDGTTPIANTRVRVYDSNWNYKTYDYTDSNGQYIFGGLVSGSYYVKADGYVDGQGYVYFKEYYNNTSDQSSASLVTVTVPDTTTGIDFTLDQGGVISGTVYKEDGTTPIANTGVYVYDSGWNIVTGIYTDSNGHYTFGGLVSGSYYVKAYGYVDGQGFVYFPEYYNNTSDQSSASLVTVTVPDTTTGIDFTLDQGGAISGTVYKEDGTTPIANTAVSVYDSDWNMVTGIYTDSNGQYICQGLETGDYYVEADGYVSGQGNVYLEEYYNNASDQSSASLVTVTVPDTTTDIDFTLEQGGAISGTVYESDGITPIVNIGVYVYVSGWNIVTGIYTDSNGFKFE